MNTPMDYEPGRPLPGVPLDPAKAHEVLHKARHDIRTAMHVVTGMAEVLAMAGNLPLREREIVGTMKRNADRSLQLIEDMFDALEPEKKAAPALRNFAYPPARHASEAPPKPRVLVVEDDESNVLVISSFLEDMKYDCDIAPGGEDAIRRFRAGRYDAIIMDVQLRGMDGLDTTRAIRQLEQQGHLPPTPIIGATGHATQDDALFCRRAGMNDYISKPFTRAGLEQKLQGVLPPSRKNPC